MSNLKLPRGVTGELLLADQSDGETAVTTGFVKTPFYSESLSQSEGLEDDPVIGAPRTNNRDTQAPAPGLATHGGGLEVPLCFNNLGWWLIGAFGAPVTTAAKATGSLVFASQPDASSTITINGTAFTFVAGSPGSDEIQIGASLADTVTAIVSALNGSADGDVDDATYDETGGTTVTIEHDTGGPAGNAFTLAAGAGSNATASGSTLSSGHYVHTFTSGGETLPSRTLGFRKRVPSSGDPVWFRDIGVLVQSIQFGVAREAGFRRVALDLVGVRQDKVAPSVFGSPADALALDQVAAALGVMRIDSVDVGILRSQQMTYANGLQPLGLVTNSKYEKGYALDDLARFSGQATVRYSSEDFYDWSVDGSTKAVEMEWSNGTGRSLTVLAPSVRAERHGVPINGPAGIDATVSLAAHQTSSAAMVSAVLRNGLSAYPEP